MSDQATEYYNERSTPKEDVKAKYLKYKAKYKDFKQKYEDKVEEV